MKPLILDFAINKKPDTTPCYSYDEKLNLNIIEIKGKKVPFIESNYCNTELITVTKAAGEQDDFELNTLELTTKTKAKGERDDIDINLLELLTKTRIEREKDDEDDFINYQ